MWSTASVTDWFYADVAQSWHSYKGTFRNHFLRIHGDMDSDVNVSEWTPFKDLLCGKDFAAATKHHGVFCALLQFFPDWIF